MKTCSKESGQRLAELGVTKKSSFVWLHPRWEGETESVLKYQNGLINLDYDTWMKGMYDPAYTACELGEMLPRLTEITKGDDDAWVVQHYNPQFKPHWDEVLPEAMALMLIWLLENGHITKEEVNA